MAENSSPVMFVSGLGRCGTTMLMTMLMTMLDAGGFPVTGPRPSYEIPDRWRPGTTSPAEWLDAQRGRAVKYLDPTVFPLPAQFGVPAVTVLMRRNPRQQARSQIKMITGSAAKDPAIEGAMMRSIVRDLPRARAALNRLGPTYDLDFADVLKRPVDVAVFLSDIISAHFPAQQFDCAAAARIVVPRSAACRPDFAIEDYYLPALGPILPAVRHEI
jgi:hypothetical protein